MQDNPRSGLETIIRTNELYTCSLWTSQFFYFPHLAFWKWPFMWSEYPILKNGKQVNKQQLLGHSIKRYTKFQLNNYVKKLKSAMSLDSAYRPTNPWLRMGFPLRRHVVAISHWRPLNIHLCLCFRSEITSGFTNGGVKRKPRPEEDRRSRNVDIYRTSLV